MHEPLLCGCCGLTSKLYVKCTFYAGQGGVPACMFILTTGIREETALAAAEVGAHAAVSVTLQSPGLMSFAAEHSFHASCTPVAACVRMHCVVSKCSMVKGARNTNVRNMHGSCGSRRIETKLSRVVRTHSGIIVTPAVKAYAFDVDRTCLSPPHGTRLESLPGLSHQNASESAFFSICRLYCTRLYATLPAIPLSATFVR